MTARELARYVADLAHQGALPRGSPDPPMHLKIFAKLEKDATRWLHKIRACIKLMRE